MQEEKDERTEGKEKEEIYANAVRAGKRTYFFDVRATRGNDYYLTITESKRKFDDSGTPYYQKHKIFLYKEDFEKFARALNESFQKVIELIREKDEKFTQELKDSFTEVDFDDLGKE